MTCTTPCFLPWPERCVAYWWRGRHRGGRRGTRGTAEGAILLAATSSGHQRHTHNLSALHARMGIRMRCLPCVMALSSVEQVAAPTPGTCSCSPELRVPPARWRAAWRSPPPAGATALCVGEARGQSVEALCYVPHTNNTHPLYWVPALLLPQRPSLQKQHGHHSLSCLTRSSRRRQGWCFRLRQPRRAQ